MKGTRRVSCRELEARLAVRQQYHDGLSIFAPLHECRLCEREASSHVRDAALELEIRKPFCKSRRVTGQRHDKLPNIRVLRDRDLHGLRPHHVQGGQVLHERRHEIKSGLLKRLGDVDGKHEILHRVASRGWRAHVHIARRRLVPLDRLVAEADALAGERYHNWLHPLLGPAATGLRARHPRPPLPKHAVDIAGLDIALLGFGVRGAGLPSVQGSLQSCDVDCVLGEWGAWMPCSKACGGGTQERMKPVMVPLAGKGICFGDKAIERYESTACNVDVCPPTATCNAMQDLVLAVDVSESFQQAGFDLMSAFVQNLTSLYVMGPAAVQISIAEYSNVGKLVVPLTGDPTTLAKGLANLQFQRGITDMAAGLSLAKTALMEGRKDAQSVVVLLTDGKPSFQFATRNAASALRDSGVRLVVAP